MLRYDVFTQDNTGELHYGSRRDGVPATSQTLGLGDREVAMITDAHDLVPGSVIYSNNSWLLIQDVQPAERAGWPCAVAYDFLPPYDDPCITFGGEGWSKAMMRRLLGEAYAMAPNHA